MIKARFVEEQPEIKIVTLEGKHFIYICRNGEKKREIYQNEGRDGAVDYWEYDYWEGVEDASEVNKKYIKENIEEFIYKFENNQVS